MGEGPNWSGAVRWIIYASVALLVVIGFFTVRFLTAAGTFTTYGQEISADCDVIEAVPGPEDIAIDRERGVAFVSAVDRRRIAEGGPGAEAIRGGIYVIDLTGASDTWALRPVTARAPEDFRPHGIGLHVAGDDRRYLFAVNHPAAGGHTVEIFEVVEDNLLEHRQTVMSDLIVHPNDVQPVSADAFYMTNDHGSSSAPGRLIEDFLLADRASVIYWADEKARVAADDLTYANGVNVSPDGTRVYVAETLDSTLRIYARDTETGALSLREQVYLGTGVDNIDVQEDGRLLIGAHPSGTDFVAHAGDASKLSPSQVVEVTPNQAGGGVARTLMLNDGALLSGSATAAGYNGLMLVSGVFQPEILVCSQTAALEAE